MYNLFYNLTVKLFVVICFGSFLIHTPNINDFSHLKMPFYSFKTEQLSSLQPQSNKIHFI